MVGNKLEQGREELWEKSKLRGREGERKTEHRGGEGVDQTKTNQREVEQSNYKREEGEQTHAIREVWAD